ncbi:MULTISPECIES: cellulose biosynthesis protein BcsQ [Edwardsiella]|uniref:Cellulose synthase operon protein YhjQ n=2 Tax=Edwardsiella anguillarum TaxID=1821960 RepID=A0A076LHS6_9GAMM|nr:MULTISPECIES: cellulose biosynthesis protein BcsQ [Edwardsiella]AKM46533.1 cell division protein [Edwardsiella sp. EA181011]GAJ67544.1 cell division protein [Edwardsiella piscicida]AIJ08065.1 cellulose synthase operon protein YhjQ [Edwardsiella anguillarum ET080813]AKR79136.1 cellulose synthase operon protein YhjQ [Edwardsiella sp. LADL05-105]KAB0591901.1 cellulose synthase operon protein YhjQ [Edwardsiella anguillarum]
MVTVALQGIRGGVGTTGTAAALGWALNGLGQRVLVVDASPGAQLGMHFNLPLADRAGWAAALLDGSAWQATAWRYTEGLDVLPFGTVDPAQLPALAACVSQAEWRASFASQSAAYDWIILDIGSGHAPVSRQMAAFSELLLLLMMPDANCHLRLHRQALPDDAHLLITQLLPGSVLQEDLYLLWKQTLPRLVPLVMHRDEAVAEAAAGKQPLGEYAPYSQAAQEATNLAAWCLLQRLPGQRPARAEAT